jgi:hypothetical protein
MMKRTLAALCAGMIGLGATAVEANAAPGQTLQVMGIPVDPAIRIAHRRGFYIVGGVHYYNSHRGVVRYRPGYRYYNGWWFPAAAFTAGVVAGAAVAAPPPPPPARLAAAHVRWCYAHYASYRAWDNSYQPYVGPRRQCISPYG